MSDPREDSEPAWAEIAPHVDEALAEFPDELAVPLTLHYLQGQSQTEVASALGVDQSTISRRVERGLEELREKLRQAGIAVPVAALGSLLDQNATIAVPASLLASLGKMAMSGVGGASSSAVVSSVGTHSAASAGAISSAGGMTLGAKVTVAASLAAASITGLVAHRHLGGTRPQVTASSRDDPSGNRQRLEDPASASAVAPSASQTPQAADHWNGFGFSDAPARFRQSEVPKGLNDLIQMRGLFPSPAKDIEFLVAYNRVIDKMPKGKLNFHAGITYTTSLPEIPVLRRAIGLLIQRVKEGGDDRDAERLAKSIGMLSNQAMIYFTVRLVVLRQLERAVGRQRARELCDEYGKAMEDLADIVDAECMYVHDLFHDLGALKVLAEHKDIELEGTDHTALLTSYEKWRPSFVELSQLAHEGEPKDLAEYSDGIRKRLARQPAGPAERILAETWPDWRTVVDQAVGLKE